MFDTVRAYHKVSLDESLFSNKSVWRVKKVNKPGHRTAENPIYEYYTSINGIYISYVLKMLIVEFSIPCLLYGSNTIMYSDADYGKFIKEIDERICTILNSTSIPSFENWTITRLDCCYNYFVNSKEDKQVYIDTFKKVHLSRYNFIEKYKTSHYSFNKSATVSMYDKSHQLTDCGKEIMNESDYYILRVEIQLKNAKLRDKYKNRRVTDILKAEVAKATLENYIKKLFMNNFLMAEADLLNAIKTKFSPCRGENLIKFVTMLNHDGIILTKKSYSSSSYYSYIKTFKANNLNPIFLKDQVNCPVDWSIHF